MGRIREACRLKIIKWLKLEDFIKYNIEEKLKEMAGGHIHPKQEIRRLRAGITALDKLATELEGRLK